VGGEVIRETARVEVESSIGKPVWAFEHCSTTSSFCSFPSSFYRRPAVRSRLNNAFYAVQQRQLAGEAGYAPTVRVATKRVGNKVEVRISDNGPGMSPEVQAKIFQPFFTTKPPGEGTGLGLSLAHDIIAQGYGGTLTVETELGKGSTFLLELPALSQQTGGPN
jgi:light-regulated signal transduction histidine kinase (bacteriophytochrome)